MSVRPILLQKDGAIKGIPGTYRTIPPPIAGIYAGSDDLENVTYYTVNSSGEAELKTVKAYPFYVDSVSGGLDTSGDGTIANPWRSVNYALSQLQSILTCLNTNYCCVYIVLRVKGTVDYIAHRSDWEAFNGYDRFIIEPWGMDTFEIILNEDYEQSNFNEIFYQIYHSIFKNISITINDTINRVAFCAFECSYSIFNNINVNITKSLNIYLMETRAFRNCPYSVFYKCNVEIEIPNNSNLFGSSSYANGFSTCVNSIFYESTCTINETASTNPYVLYMVGFEACASSLFFSCNGYVSSTVSNTLGCGFLGNTNSTFLICTGNSLNRTDCDI